MKDKTVAIAQWLKLAGCLIISIAIIFGFVDIFSLFTVWAPLKSALMLGVLLFTLGVANAAVLFPGLIARRIGLVHTANLVLLTFVYVIVANLVSVLTAAGSAVWYLIWQLILLGLYGLSLSTIGFFAERTSADSSRDRMEQQAKQTVAMQLMNIDTALRARGLDEDRSLVDRSFLLLKERLQASTPFGRIGNNQQVADLEQQIMHNLEYIWMQSKADWTPSAIIELQKTIEETKRLAMAREKMNIR